MQKIDKDVILHIGYHKTASTWFQKNFYPFVKDAFYCVPKISQKIFICPSGLQFNEQKAIEEIIDLSGEKKRIIICDEELSGNIHNGGLNGFATKIFADRLVSVFTTPKIVIFIRNQYKMIESVYRQYIKKGGTKKIEDYLFSKHSPNRIPTFSFNHLLYLDTINYYKSLLGGNVNIFLFEDFIDDKRMVIDFFKRSIGLDVVLPEIDFKEKNTSYGDLICSIAKLCNHFTEKDVINKHHLFHVPKLFEISHRILGKINKLKIKTGIRRGEQSNIIDTRLKNYICNYYKDNNRRLMETFGLDLTKYGYPI